MRTLRRTILLMISHPRISLGVLIAVIILIIAISHSSDSATPVTQKPLPSAPAPAPANPAPSHPNLSPGPGGSNHKKHKKHRNPAQTVPPAQIKPPAGVFQEDPSQDAIRQGVPILQQLPLQTKNFKALLVDSSPNGKYVIQIVYKGSKEIATQNWNVFLNRYNDPGTEYLVIYQRQK